MAGPAIVDTLFGDANPGGKLPVTFPRSVGQIPIYYNQKNTGRPFKASEKYTSKYLDIDNTPLYPFGYGLSYTTFAIENLQLDKERNSADGKRTSLSSTLKTSAESRGRRGRTALHHDVAATVTRPVKELKGFQSRYTAARSETNGRIYTRRRKN